jgi:hypothetical protein
MDRWNVGGETISELSLKLFLMLQKEVGPHQEKPHALMCANTRDLAHISANEC